MKVLEDEAVQVLEAARWRGVQRFYSLVTLQYSSACVCNIWSRNDKGTGNRNKMVAFRL